jgi:hypothetical protein
MSIYQARQHGLPLAINHSDFVGSNAGQFTLVELVYLIIGEFYGVKAL